MSADEFAAAFPFRLRQVEDAVKAIQTWRSKVDTDRAIQTEQLKTLDVRMADLTSSVDSLRKTILGFSLTIAGAAVVFGLTVLTATGKI